MEPLLQSLLNAVAQGELSPDAALEKLRFLPLETLEDIACLDHHRSLRTGFPEVVWGPGKTPTQIVSICRRLAEHQPLVLVTRLEMAVYTQVRADLPGLHYNAVARLGFLGTPPQQPLHRGLIGVVAAGTADLPVAEEAAATAELSGFQVARFWDLGVAGLQRLLYHWPAMAKAHVLIVVAGMEGALPSVVAGLAACPVIGVPTSIGYGSHFQGLTPLLAMLNSCAAGIGVVNIDNGFGAAMLAGQILRTAGRLQGSDKVGQ